MVLLKVDDTKIHRDTVGGVYKQLRNVAAWESKKSSVMLGGQGRIVEIDETLMFKVKYNRGSGLKRKKIWVFGMIERDCKKGEKVKKCHMEVVKNRKAETLLRIIYDHVLPGSIIMSDKWSSYSKISQLKEFEHKTVNHSYHFVDPESGAYTNGIEGAWTQLKRKLKDMNGCSRLYL